MIKCIKTGALICVEEHKEFAYGDAFELEIDGGPGSLIQVYFFRLVARSYEPINGGLLHFTVHSIDQWWDDNKTSMEHTSTLVATSVTNHGYQGKVIT